LDILVVNHQILLQAQVNATALFLKFIYLFIYLFFKLFMKFLFIYLHHHHPA